MVDEAFRRVLSNPYASLILVFSVVFYYLNKKSINDAYQTKSRISLDLVISKRHDKPAVAFTLPRRSKACRENLKNRKHYQNLSVCLNVSHTIKEVSPLQ